MKKELIYLWILKDKNNCFNEQGFNFSPKYNASYDLETNELIIRENKAVNIFSKDNIVNLSAIVGENGTGKTTLLQFLNSLSCVPLSDLKEKHYHVDNYLDNSSYIHRSFIAVYLLDDKYYIINNTEKTITYKNKPIRPITNYDYRNDDFLGTITHIYFTNSEYAKDTNLFKGGGNIDHVSIFNGALNFVASNFYKFTINYGKRFPDSKTHLFDSLQEYLIHEKTIRNFQQILDVLFLFKHQNRHNEYEYLGKQISTVKVSFVDCAKYLYDFIIMLDMNDSRREWATNAFNLFANILENCKIRNYNVLEFLIINLAFELTLIYKITFDDCEVRNIYKKCRHYIETQISDNLEKDYYTSALAEIDIFYKMVKKCPIVNNSIPKDDSGYKEYCQISISILGKFLASLQDRTSSFIAKYINIEGLELSSGERALLNFSSRIEMLDYFYKLEGRGFYKPNKNILILIDEIDLYVHPNAQRKLVSSLINQINSLFKEHFVQIILSSHSPIVLSDIPSEQSIFLNKNSSNKIVVYEGGYRQTFAANISTLYKDSFFIEGGIGIGEYALSVINEIANELHNNSGDLTHEQMEIYASIISLIGEPIIKNKLFEMLDRLGDAKHNQSKTPPKDVEMYLDFLRTQRNAIDAEIKRLEGKL